MTLEPERIAILHSHNSRWRHRFAQRRRLRHAADGAGATEHCDHGGGTNQPWLGPHGHPAAVTRTAHRMTTSEAYSQSRLAVLFLSAFVGGSAERDECYRFHRVRLLAHPVATGWSSNGIATMFSSIRYSATCRTAISAGCSFLTRRLAQTAFRSIRHCIRPSTGRICVCGPIPEQANRFTGFRCWRNATPVVGSYTPASATFELQGAPTGGDYIELAWDEEHYTYQLYGADTLHRRRPHWLTASTRFRKRCRRRRTAPLSR